MVMQAFRYALIRLAVLLTVASLISCDPWFSFSPYGSDVAETYKGLGEENLARLESADAGDSKPFKVALLADPHYHFSKVNDAIADINQRGYFDFVLVLGDLTENGLRQEFIFFHQSMKALTIPYLTIIGNHDYLSTGEDVYRKMYGDFNYSFVFNNVKFVMFDNIVWESGKEPDFNWLAATLASGHGYDHVIPFSHIPPSDRQMEEYREGFHQLLLKNNIRLSIHGHSHDFSLRELYGDGILYHTVPSPQKRAYTELTVTPDTVTVHKIQY